MKRFSLPSIFILSLILLLGSCTKNARIQGNANSILLYKICGSYVGTLQHRAQTNTGSAIYKDSTSILDTITISKIGTDTFLLNKPIWDICNPGFKVLNTSTYLRSRGTSAFNDHFDEINIHFDTISHSLTIHKHYVFVSSWLMENWDDFSGIQVP